MKHIKNFDNKKIKNYFVCDDIRIDGVSVYKVLGNKMDDLTLKIICRFDNGIKKEHIHNMVYYGNKYENLNIHYETDDLNDAIKKCKIYSITTKYNL